MSALHSNLELHFVRILNSRGENRTAKLADDRT